MIDLLIKLLPYAAPAIRWADDKQRPYWRIDLLVYTLSVLIADSVLCHLFFVPQYNEWTISQTLERTAKDSADSMRLALAINQVSPGHIKI